MKKIIYSMLAISAMIFVTSCSENDMLPNDVNENEAQVSFTLELPDGPQTRTIGDGTGVNKLVYAVYEDGNVDKVANLSSDGSENTVVFPKTVTLSLLKGKTYKIAFWAQNNECDAYDTANLKAVTVNYAVNGGKNNDEKRDAFFKSIEIEVTGNSTLDVELKRPFAQLNVGVTDWEEAQTAGFAVSKSEVVISKVAKEINLLDGSVKGNEDVTYNLADIPTENLSVNIDGTATDYKYLSLSYLLVNDANAGGDAKATLESVSFDFQDGSGKSAKLENITNVPVQRNYRTNIIGKLLTGDAVFEISIDSDFDKPDNNILSVSTPAELQAALDNVKVSKILIGGVIGSESAYTVYNVNRPVTIQGLTTRAAAGAKVFGTFMVKADGVTIENLAIQNKGNLKGESSNNRGGIYVFANNVTITNNTFISGLGDDVEGLANAIQIMSPTAGNPLSNYKLEGNTISGFKNVLGESKSAGVIITQGHKPGSAGAFVEEITATDSDYQKLLGKNTFNDNTIDLQHADWGKGGLVLFPYTEVTSKTELTGALEDKRVGVIVVNGTIGNNNDYTVYTLNRKYVRIKGKENSKVFGTFIVKSEGVSIKDLAIENKGDLKGESSTNRGGIYVFAEKIIIANNTFTNGLGTAEGLSNAIQIMSPIAGNPLSNYEVRGNSFKGHLNTVSSWSSSGIVIAEGYTPGSIGEKVLSITAEPADYKKLLDNNTFENNAINLIHQDWSKIGDDVVLYPLTKN